MEEKQRESVRYTIECLPEDTPVRGNALSSGDTEEDCKAENAILAALECNPWAWCLVRVRAWAGSVYGEDYLGCCSYESEEDFKRGGYWEDMQATALSDLQVRLTLANEAISTNPRDARIAELEGALRMMVEQYGCVTRVTRGTDPEKNGDPYVAQARRVLGEGGRS